MDLQFKTIPFEIKSTSGDGSEGAGHASVFFNIDSANEIVDDKSFDADLADFMADGFVGGLNHSWDDPIGNPTKATPDGTGLAVGWKLSPTAHGRDCMILLKDKVVKKLSIGYRVLGDMLLETYDDVVAYWKTKNYKPNAEDTARAQMGYIRVLTRIKLYEFSPVTVPANSMAAITAVKALQAKSLLSGGDPAVDPPVEPIVSEADTTESRLQKIAKSEAISVVEDALREAGFSNAEAKALISSIHRLKALPREVASDDDGNKPNTETDSVTPPAEQPAEDASVTPAPEGKPEQKASDDAQVPPAPNSPLASDDDEAPTPLEAEKQRLKREASWKLHQQTLALSGAIAQTVSGIAGANYDRP